MNIRNCIKCGKIFNYITGMPVCVPCRNKMEDEFQIVKKFIRDNRDATIAEVSEECKVPIKQIHVWVREERLAFSDNSCIGIECERCRKTIKTGRFCDGCKHEMQHTMGKVYATMNKETQTKETKTTSDSRIRYLERHGKD